MSTIHNEREKFIKIYGIDDIINEVLHNLAEDFSEHNEIFLSEADLQFNFAKKLYELHHEVDTVDNIILEYPILTKELYCKSNICKEFIKANYRRNCKNKEDKFNNDRTYIDLNFKYAGKEYFIEFKYKLDEIGKVERYEREININKQGAEYIGRHQVYEDIERMENIIKIKDDKEDRKAYVILITNDNAYWEINQENGKTTYNFPLAIENDCNTTKCGELEYLSNAEKYPRKLFIEKKYKINWTPFINLNHGKKQKFQAMIIDCSNPLEN